jgi:hypothetical protein
MKDAINVRTKLQNIKAKHCSLYNSDKGQNYISLNETFFTLNQIQFTVKKSRLQVKEVQIALFVLKL